MTGLGVQTRTDAYTHTHTHGGAHTDGHHVRHIHALQSSPLPSSHVATPRHNTLANPTPPCNTLPHTHHTMNSKNLTHSPQCDTRHHHNMHQKTRRSTRGTWWCIRWSPPSSRGACSSSTRATTSSPSRSVGPFGSMCGRVFEGGGSVCPSIYVCTRPCLEGVCVHVDVCVFHKGLVHVEVGVSVQVCLDVSVKKVGCVGGV